MSIKIDDFANLPTDEVTTEQTRLIALASAFNPSHDFQAGVLRDVVLKLSALLGTSLGQDWTRLKSSGTIYDINLDPTIADDDIVNALLSNYGMHRREGVKSAGSITIVLTAQSEISIPAGSAFVANGLTYVADQTYSTHRTSSTVISDNDRLLVARTDGTWSFSIGVIAQNAGPEYRLTRNSLVVPSFSINAFQKAFASNDFSDGTNTETNAELIADIANGMSAQILSNRANMSALLVANFPDTVGSSLIGAGDVEMSRDNRSIFPISPGGRADWYIKSQLYPSTKTLVKACSLVSVSGTAGTWQCTLTRTEAAGAYEVISVLPIGVPQESGTLTISSSSRGVDTSGLSTYPDIVGDEVSFTRYQTLTVTFIDDTTDHSALSIGSERTYSIAVRYMEAIAAIQDYSQQIGIQNYGGDLLVKAAIPCFVTIGMTIHKTESMATPDLEEIKQAISVLINQTEFPAHLTTSQISDVVHNYLDSPAGVSSMVLSGRTIKPDGSERIDSSTSRLEALNLPELGVSKNTVTFFCDTNDINITVKNL